LKLPRDLSGFEFSKLLRRYGYEATRQVGSHIRLTSTIRGTQHHVTVPAHKELKLGTLANILSEVSAYLGMSRTGLERELFGD
jgi:predicted RNA binding protein YcfA (HicA-like mRNA interferase family)